MRWAPTPETRWTPTDDREGYREHLRTFLTASGMSEDHSVFALLMAAPDLYEALETLVRRFDGYPDDPGPLIRDDMQCVGGVTWGDVQDARAALARARGETTLTDQARRIKRGW